MDPAEGRLDRVPRETVDGEPWPRRTAVAVTRDGVAAAHGSLGERRAEFGGDAVEGSREAARLQEQDGGEECRPSPVRDAADDRVIARDRTPDLVAARHARGDQVVGQTAHADLVAE